MKTYLILCFLTLFIWETPAVKDTNRQEAQAETGRQITEESSLPQNLKQRSSFEQKNNTIPKSGKRVEEPDYTVALLILAALWITLGVLMPAHPVALIVNILGIILAAFAAIAGIKLPFASTLGRNPLDSMAKTATNLAVGGCFGMIILSLSLLVLIASIVIVVNQGWPILIFLGVFAGITSMIMLFD